MFGISAFAESPFASLAGLAGNVNVSLTGQSATGSVGTTTFVCAANRKITIVVDRSCFIFIQLLILP